MATFSEFQLVTAMATQTPASTTKQLTTRACPLTFTETTRVVVFAKTANITLWA